MNEPADTHNEADTGELPLPDRTNELLSDVLIALSAAAGVAGCLAWDVGPVFYFVPFGLAGAALVLLIAGFNITRQVNVVAAGIATIAMIGSGWIGISKKSDYDDLSRQAQQAAERFDQFAD